MSVLPKKVSKAWNERKGPVIFATVDGNGVPNAIYATCVKKFNEDTIVIADNFFDKTRKNILAQTINSISQHPDFQLHRSDYHQLIIF